jgi:hypothetical protein
MQLLKQIFLPLAVLCSLPVSAQIVTKPQRPGQQPVPIDTVVPKEKRVPTDGTDEFTFYAGGAYVLADRSLKPNKEPFGEPLGERENEIPVSTFSLGLGVRNRINSWSSYDVGLMYDKTGEAYDFADEFGDSTYSYKTTYSYFSMPVQFLFTYGEDVRLFLGPGIQAGLFAGYNRKTESTDSDGREASESTSMSDHINEFTFGLLGTSGVQVRLSRGMSFYLMGTLLRNLTSTYDNQADYIHKATTFSVKLGLAFHFPDSGAE